MQKKVKQREFLQNNMKTIVIAKKTQKFLAKNKQTLLNKIKEREEDKYAR